MDERIDCPICGDRGEHERACACTGRSRSYRCCACGDTGILVDDCERCEGRGWLELAELTEDERLQRELPLDEENTPA